MRDSPWLHIEGYKSHACQRNRKICYALALYTRINSFCASLYYIPYNLLYDYTMPFPHVYLCGCNHNRRHVIAHNLIWYDMIWHDMTRHGITRHNMTWYMIRYDAMRYDTIRCDIWYYVWYAKYQVNITFLRSGTGLYSCPHRLLISSHASQQCPIHDIILVSPPH